MNKSLVKDQPASISSSLRLDSAVSQSKRSRTKTSHFEIRATRDFPVARPEKKILEDDAQYQLGYN
ncbi:MAG: hypothetical protein AAF542_16575 [Pseudomonadota bacterium]